MHAQSDTEPIRLTSERQLFVDEGFQSEQQGLARTLHQPQRHPFNPVLTQVYPWEANTVSPAAVLREPATGVFRMWYTTQDSVLKRSASTPEEKERIGYICYAESDDGLHWRRPALGIFESRTPWKLPWDAPPQVDRSVANNIVMRNLAHLGAQNPGVALEFLCRDDDEPDPGKRYKAMIWQKGDRYKELDEQGRPETGKIITAHCATYSPDGIHWSEAQPRLVYPMFRDSGSAMHDWKNRRFVGFFKTSLREVRTRAICISDDMIDWTEPQVILEADEQDPEYAQLYYNRSFIYESMYLGTLALFRAGDEATTDLQFIHSRDGLSWTRGFGRQTFFAHGRPGTDWDGGIINYLLPPLVINEELWFYYGGYSGRHWQVAQRTAVGVAVLRRDGFVSLDAPDQGWLLTPTVQCQGSYLYINADASHGRIEVEVCDSQGRLLEGYARTDCVPISHDGTRLCCAWQDNRRLPIPAQQPLRLKFYLSGASLYALWCE